MRSYFGISDVGCVRKNNEDSLLLSPELGLYAVADGMGGANAGETASRLAIERLRDELASSPTRDENTLTRAFQQANSVVLQASNDDHTLEGMGTTLVCAIEAGDRILVASVGDSRAWLFQQGQLVQVSDDQTWVNEVGRRLGLTEDRLKSHPMRHVLTMAVGVNEDLRVQMYALQPPVGSILLLSSDGLHGPLSDPEIENILNSGITLEARGHSLIEAAKQAGGPDNITVVLLEF